jgi:hypothetical protein
LEIYRHITILGQSFFLQVLANIRKNCGFSCCSNHTRIKGGQKSHCEKNLTALNEMDGCPVLSSTDKVEADGTPGVFVKPVSDDGCTTDVVLDPRLVGPDGQACISLGYVAIICSFCGLVLFLLQINSAFCGFNLEFL